MDAKNLILNSAIELFAKRGFDGVSIREIAALAEVHFASIRYHFGDKEDLYTACISKHGEERLLSSQRFLSAEVESSKDMRQRLALALEDVFRIHNDNPYLTKLLLLELESSEPRADTALKNTMVAMAQTYANFFKACQKKGYLNKDLDPLILTQSLMGVLHHFMRTELTRERLLNQKKLKHEKEKKLLIENIIMIFLGSYNSRSFK